MECVRIGEVRNAGKILVRKPGEEKRLEDLGVDSTVISKLILSKP